MATIMSYYTTHIHLLIQKERKKLYHISSSGQTAVSKTNFLVNALSFTATELVPAHLEKNMKSGSVWRRTVCYFLLNYQN